MSHPTAAGGPMPPTPGERHPPPPPMTQPLPPRGDLDLGARVETLATRWCFNTGLISSLLAALLIAGPTTRAPSPSARALLVGSCVALALFFAAARRLGGGRRRIGSLLVAAWASVALIFLVSIGLGAGVHGVALGFLAIVVGLVCVIVSAPA